MHHAHVGFQRVVQLFAWRDFSFRGESLFQPATVTSWSSLSLGTGRLSRMSPRTQRLDKNNTKHDPCTMFFEMLPAKTGLPGILESLT